MEVIFYIQALQSIKDSWKLQLKLRQLKNGKGFTVTFMTPTNTVPGTTPDMAAMNIHIARKDYE